MAASVHYKALLNSSINKIATSYRAWHGDRKGLFVVVVCFVSCVV